MAAIHRLIGTIAVSLSGFTHDNGCFCSAESAAGFASGYHGLLGVWRAQCKRYNCDNKIKVGINRLLSRQAFIETMKAMVKLARAKASNGWEHLC